MNKTDFIEKYFKDNKEASKDLDSVIKNLNNVNEPTLLIIKNALKWIGINIPDRTLFIVVACYERIKLKNTSFSMKDAADLFSDAERKYTQEGRASFGGQYFYLDEFFDKCSTNDQRTEVDNKRFENGNYSLEEGVIDMLRKYLLTNFIKPAKN